MQDHIIDGCNVEFHDECLHLEGPLAKLSDTFCSLTYNCDVTYAITSRAEVRIGLVDLILISHCCMMLS